MKILELIDNYEHCSWGIYSETHRKVLEEACDLNPWFQIEEVKLDKGILNLQNQIKKYKVAKKKHEAQGSKL